MIARMRDHGDVARTRRRVHAASLREEQARRRAPRRESVRSGRTQTQAPAGAWVCCS